MKAASTLKKSEADLKKATEDLEEMRRARDTAASDLAVARKQAEDQTTRLQDIEGQLQNAKEDNDYLKQELTKAIHEKGIVEYARDEAVRAKDEAVFAKIDAEHSVEQAEEEAFASGVAKTEAILRAQVPAVCRHYCSQTWHEALNQAGIDASSDLRRKDRVYYPIAIRETAIDAPEEGSSLPAIESHDKTADDISLTDQPSEEIEPQRTLGGARAEGQEIPPDVARLPTDLSKQSP